MIKVKTIEEQKKLVERLKKENPELKRFFGSDTDDIKPKLDPRFTERLEGETPSGGDFCIAYYYDEDHNPCERSKAKYVNIVEYKNNWKRVNETYGIMG